MHTHTLMLTHAVYIHTLHTPTPHMHSTHTTPHTHTRPYQVCKGFYGVSDQTAVTTGDIFNLHFLKNTKNCCRGDKRGTDIVCGSYTPAHSHSLTPSPSPSHPHPHTLILTLTITFTSSPSHPHLHTLTFLSSHPHPHPHTFTSSPSHPHLHTLTFLSSHPHTLTGHKAEHPSELLHNGEPPL